MGAHPFLTLTLFIAMFERDHGPLEYQIGYGQALSTCRCPTPTSPPDMPPVDAGRRAPHARVAAVVRRAPVTCSRPGSTLVRVTAAPVVPLDLLCASGTSYFGVPATPYVPGGQGVGTVVESQTHAPARGCGSSRRRG